MAKIIYKVKNRIKQTHEHNIWLGFLLKLSGLLFGILMVVISLFPEEIEFNDWRFFYFDYKAKFIDSYEIDLNKELNKKDSIDNRLFLFVMDVSGSFIENNPIDDNLIITSNNFKKKEGLENINVNENKIISIQKSFISKTLSELNVDSLKGVSKRGVVR